MNSNQRNSCTVLNQLQLKARVLLGFFLVLSTANDSDVIREHLTASKDADKKRATLLPWLLIVPR